MQKVCATLSIFENGCAGEENVVETTTRIERGGRDHQGRVHQVTELVFFVSTMVCANSATFASGGFYAGLSIYKTCTKSVVRKSG
jgi:hypothetical protein